MRIARYVVTSKQNYDSYFSTFTLLNVYTNKVFHYSLDIRNRHRDEEQNFKLLNRALQTGEVLKRYRLDNRIRFK